MGTRGTTDWGLPLADEAVIIGQKAAALRPDNPETLGNLACDYLFAARFPEAITTIKAALKINPNDETNLYLRKMISDVQSGNRTQPRTLFDVTSSGQSQPESPPIEPAVKKRPFWKRWFLPGIISSVISTALTAAEPLVIRVEPTGWGDSSGASKVSAIRLSPCGSQRRRSSDTQSCLRKEYKATANAPTHWWLVVSYVELPVLPHSLQSQPLVWQARRLTGR